jgi:hypothetical protein
MNREIDDYFLLKDEPVKSYLLSLRDMILKFNPGISEAWKYKMPFYCYHGKMVCYLWVHKKFKQPYLGIVEGKKVNHPGLLLEKRARMKILLLDPEKDIPVKTIREILRKILTLY